MAQVVLQPGRDRAPRRRHPWVLSGAVSRVEGDPEPGAVVSLLSSEGEVLGTGCWSPRSELRVRLHAFGKEPPGSDWLEQRIAASLARREGDASLHDTDAVRLVNAEADDLPGLVVDRYADVVVVRTSAAGMLTRRDEIASVLRECAGAARGFARDDAAAARREGLAPRQGPLWGDAPAEAVAIREGDRRYAVDVVSGQKTGFYLDQRQARDAVESFAAGLRVLDLFAYTGGFAVAAAVGGAAAVTLVDSSRDALLRAEAHLRPFAHATAVERVEADAFDWLRGGSSEFDCIVIDPPPLARRKGDVSRATRAYKDLLLHGLRRLAPGGSLLAFACSHHVSPELFRQVAFGAALDARRRVQVLRTLEAPSDHPVSLDHPEGRYLSGLWLRAIS